jgi:predicted kinase
MLINGAPGSGKSTLAAALAERVPMMLALDVDGIKHALGRWEDDATASGRHARRLALALVREHLSAGYDVVLGQYLARTAFIESLEAVARDLGAGFVELMLDLDPATLAARLAERSSTPGRPEHLVNNRLVAAEDAEHLVASLAHVCERRPNTTRIDAGGSIAATLEAIRALLA